MVPTGADPGPRAAAAAPRRFAAVVYDYGGVFSPSPFGAIRAYERELDLDEGTLARLLFGDSYAGGSGDGDAGWDQLETGRITLAQWWAGLQRRVETTLGPGFALDLGRAFSGGGLGVHWEVVHHVRRVKATGAATAICTNNIAEYGDHWKSTFPVDEIIDVVVDSSHEGVRKPDPTIYRRTAERLGVPPEACVFVDDLAENVDGARSVGMHALHVDDDLAPVLTEIESLLRS